MRKKTRAEVPPGKVDHTWMGTEAGFESGWLFLWFMYNILAISLERLFHI
jgi:hypothetical protein